MVWPRTDVEPDGRNVSFGTQWTSTFPLALGVIGDDDSALQSLVLLNRRSQG